MVLKTVFLFCLLPLVHCAVANDGMSLAPNAVSPTIRIDRTEFFLGEQVAFEIGKRTAKEVDGPALAEILCLFSQVGGLAPSNDRPVELLVRSKTCYGVTGERQSTGCEGAIKHWPHDPLD